MLDLEITQEKFDTLPEPLQAQYAKNGENGKFSLDIDRKQAEDIFAKPLKHSLEAVRGEKRTLADQLRAEKERLVALGIDDPEELKEAVEAYRKRRAQELIDKGEVETLIKQRTEAETKRMRAAHTEEITKTREELRTKDERLHTLLLDNPVLERCPKYGVRERAVSDVLDRARKIFKIDESGALVPRENPDGSMPRGKEGASLSLDEWFAELAVSADHLFQPNAGSGAANPQSSGAAPTGSTAGLRRNAMTMEQKSAFVEKHGMAAFDQLPR